MRIALVIEFFDPLCGGASQWTIGFAKHLLDNGHSVLVVAFRSGNHALPVQSHVLSHSNYPLERARRVRKCIQKLKPDVIYDAGSSCCGDVLHPHAGSLYLAYKIAVSKFPIVRRLRTWISPRGWFFRWSLIRVEKMQMARAKCVIAVSQSVRALLSKRHGLLDNRLVVVPNAVDVARFAPERLASLREEMRQTLKVRHKTVFLLLAESMFLKGVDNAIRALGRLVREGAAVQLVIAGGNSDPWWDRLVAKSGVEGCVCFLGYVADVVPLYAAADAIVHPTRWDACSLATIEGMAAGLPVVTSLKNGAAERICDGANGLLIDDPEDIDALADKMRRLLDPRERERIGSAARETASEYVLRDNFAQVERILVEVAMRLGEGCRPSSRPQRESSARYDEASIA